MTKRSILSKVESSPAEILFDAIKLGSVTFEELVATNKLNSTKKKEIIELQLRLKENEAWNRIKDSKIVKVFDNYIKEFPTGNHMVEAKDKRDINRRNILMQIKSNQLTPDVVKRYLDEEDLTREDLKDTCEIPEDIIKRIESYEEPDFKDILGKTPDQIPSGFTEVYFWGMPNSGKTCALSAILNTAEKKGYLQTDEGFGLKYLLVLKNLFKDDDIGYLLEGTPDKTQYLPIRLQKAKEKNGRPIALIELSGEVFKCFNKIYLGETLVSPLIETFTTLNKFLTNENRKVHFFFIDYNPTAILHNSPQQIDYLREAGNYFERNKIFFNTTDAIYIVITKSDLIEGYDEKNKTLHNINITRYVEKFLGFKNRLNTICSTEGIRGGNVSIIPFSIGQVYCKRICKIDRSPSEIILDLLFKIPLEKKNIWNK